ncbi:hypothetical protein BHT95_15555 [Bacillus paralicheniformis]|uniref:hypothetical protein n=1 Tax=Bacillus paralicheniformis TaxID=1648923 RepID=UPI0003A716CE|nr:hypothetical protein [Bacillus paralicheniformis]MSN98170.1 hypothetical protein [Bacillus paralicheniformis]MSO10165.1 hypothetical protein [Bacillus paralicheniformis]OLQ48095.1 hypothetical protein BHT95_15555 [Bacillus paralicheniformis]TWM56342.1 hypothetical protein CHCC14814_2323 [Bacillus paralicheniformis]
MQPAHLFPILPLITFDAFTIFAVGRRFHGHSGNVIPLNIEVHVKMNSPAFRYSFSRAGAGVAESK